MEQLDYNLLSRWSLTFARRPDLGPDDLHEEPRSAADRRGICQVHEQTSEPCGGQAAVVGRAFFGGRNADRGVGLAQEFSPQGRQWRRRRRGRLPRPAAQKRHACEHQRSRLPSLPQGRRAGRQSSVTWATPPWRTAMGWRWRAWSRSPTALPSAALRRSCSRPRARRPAAASRWAKIRRMTRLTMWPICAPSTLRRT